MKKIYKSLLFAIVAALPFLASSCKDDNDSNPVLNTEPTTFVLNTPTMANQLIELSADNTVSLSWSQPDYGFPALATYSIQVGVVQDSGDIIWSEGSLETTYTVCNADVSGEEIAMAINEADGFKSEEEYVNLGVRTVAMRVLSAIRNANNVSIPITEIVSNTVIFQQMISYKAIKAPKKMFIIGSCAGGWMAPEEGNREALQDWIINETGVGTGVYQGTYEIPEGTFQFRFYSDLTGWDGGASIGAKAADESTEIKMTNNAYEGSVVVPGKGSWQISDWAGGTVRITVDLGKKSVKFEKL